MGSRRQAGSLKIFSPNKEDLRERRKSTADPNPVLLSYTHMHARTHTTSLNRKQQFIKLDIHTTGGFVSDRPPPKKKLCQVKLHPTLKEKGGRDHKFFG